LITAGVTRQDKSDDALSDPFIKEKMAVNDKWPNTLDFFIEIRNGHFDGGA
jgi:hypothetical protein